MEENQELEKTQSEVEVESSVKQTKTQLFWEIFRFLLVGGIATIVDYAVSNLFNAVLLPKELIGETWALIISTAMGFCVGLVVNWFLSIFFVFKQARNKKAAKSGKSFLVFALIGIIGLGISLAGMQLVQVLPDITLFSKTEFLGSGWDWWIMKVVMTLIVLVWNYIGRKIFIFKS